MIRHRYDKNKQFSLLGMDMCWIYQWLNIPYHGSDAVTEEHNDKEEEKASANDDGLDDRHFFLWLMKHGIRDFRVCPDAPYSKSRYQKGGQGTIDERMEKCGRAIEKIARDFPEWTGSTGTLRLPWKLILDSIDGKTPDRLAGGAMRSETKLFSTGDTDG